MLLWEAPDLNTKFLKFNFLNYLESRDFIAKWMKTLKQGTLNGDYTEVV
jgi:hypothetical protein